jgi:hypothetical protein
MVGERDEADGIDPEDAILGSGENNDTESKLEGELFPKSPSVKASLPCLAKACQKSPCLKTP